MMNLNRTTTVLQHSVIDYWPTFWNGSEQTHTTQFNKNETCHYLIQLSLIMRKPVVALSEKQRRRSACAPAQSDKHLCCSLLR